MPTQHHCVQAQAPVPADTRHTAALHYLTGGLTNTTWKCLVLCRDNYHGYKYAGLATRQVFQTLSAHNCVGGGGGGGASLTEPCVNRGWAMLSVVLWLTVHYLEGQRYTVLPCVQLSHEAVNTLAKHWSVFQHKRAKRALAVVPLRIFTVQQHAKAITNPQWCVHVNECVHVCICVCVCVCVCKEGGRFQYANGVTDLLNS